MALLLFEASKFTCKPSLKSNFFYYESKEEYWLLMEASRWLICPNWTEVRRFTKNTDNKDRFN